MQFVDGRLQTTSGELCVEQSIWAILETAPGERVMRPEFGCAIHDLVFSTASAEVIGQINSAVYKALAQFETRIDVLGIEVSPDPDQRNVLRIEIDYRLRSVNSRQSLVYPFYIEAGGEDVG